VHEKKRKPKSVVNKRKTFSSSGKLDWPFSITFCGVGKSQVLQIRYDRYKEEENFPADAFLDKKSRERREQWRINSGTNNSAGAVSRTTEMMKK